MTSLNMRTLKRSGRNELIYKIDTDSGLENQLMVARGEGWREGMVRECGRDRYTLLSFKWLTNKDLLCSTWNSARCYVAAWMEGSLGKNGHMHVCG